jgi:hypothetical protein
LTPGDWMAIAAILAGSISILGGIFVTNYVNIRNEKIRKKNEFIMKEIRPLAVYMRKLSSLEKLLRREIPNSVPDEKLVALYTIYIDLC